MCRHPLWFWKQYVFVEMRMLVYYCWTLTDLVLFDLKTPKYIYSVVHVPAQHILLFGMCAASTESYCICQKTAYFIICSWMQELLYCFRLLYIQSNCTIYMYGRFWTWFYWVLGDWVHKEWTDRPTFICTVRPRDTRPRDTWTQAAQTSIMHIFE